MKVVNSTRKDGLPVQGMDIGEAYHKAIIQDALSTDDEGEGDEEVTFKKEDLNAKKEDWFCCSQEVKLSIWCCDINVCSDGEHMNNNDT